MKKIVVILSVTAFLCCCGVQSYESYDDLEKRILNSGTVVFLDFLEKVRNATEKLVRDDQFRKSRISIQGYTKTLRELVKPLKDSESVRQSQERLFRFMAGGAFRTTIQQVFDQFFFPYIKIYRETLRNDTMADIWKEVESYYLPGAPPVYSKPMQFFSHLLAKAVVKSQLVNMFEAGVDAVVEIEKTDFNQLHEDVQTVLDQIRQKASEVSALERQKDKNDFLVSLRTASGLIVFYWDQVLGHTESPSFHTQYLDSMKRWTELSELRNSSEKYHVLLDPDSRSSFFKWTDHCCGSFFEAAAQEYYSRGNAALGSDRFNQSNWAVVKSAVVYSLPVYDKLSEAGFGVSEVNRFLHKVKRIILTLEGNGLSSERITILESIVHEGLYLLSLVIEEEKTNSKDNHLLLPLRVIRRVFLEFWDSFLRFGRYRYRNQTELLQMQGKWNETRNIIFNELVKSNALSQKQLEEAPKNTVQAVHQILEKLEQYTDLVEGFYERIDPTVFALEMSMLHYNTLFDDLWDLLLE